MTTTTSDTVPNVITLLNREWQARHAATEYDFGTLGTMRGEELLRQIQHTASKDESDVLLHTVLLLAQQHTTTGEAAGRALVQAMVPTVLQLAGRSNALRTVSHAERIGTYMSCLWEAVQSYPAHQTRSVASTLTLNTLSCVNASECHRRARSPYSEIVVDAEDIVTAANSPVRSSERFGTGDESFDDLVRVLTWAVDTEVLTRDEVSTLARFDLGEEEDHDDLRREKGWNYQAMKKAVWRIRRKLMRAVQDLVLTREDF